ncbi:hypothetical protein SASPL_109035 [Salvia splendens]|uniref:malate dehydrogenase n=1 Tax=Salvia splendens TaxID=180675 RepID=A0A8X9A810_SALSN|nr:hypothetical protein SASPL_109035 [Salvia splendens]
MTTVLLRWALRRSAAASYMSIRAFASPPGQQWNVAILGAAGGIGQTPSLLMKLNPMVSHLSHYDIAGTPGVAADVSYVNTISEIQNAEKRSSALSSITGCRLLQRIQFDD